MLSQLSQLSNLKSSDCPASRSVAKRDASRRQTHDHADGSLFRRANFLECIVDNEVEEDVEPSKDTLNASTSLNEDRYTLVHELSGVSVESDEGRRDGG